jgi:hypothetical protein
MICRLIFLFAIAAALSAAEKPASYSFRRVEEMRAPQNRGEWITVGWYSESAGPDKFASRRVSVVGGQTQSDDREGYDGRRRFEISELARVRAEWFSANIPVSLRGNRYLSPQDHCLPWVSGGSQIGIRTYLGQETMLRGLLAFKIRDEPGRIAWLAPALGCSEVQVEQYTRQGLLSDKMVLSSRSRLVEWSEKTDESLFARPMKYRHVSPSVRAAESVARAPIHVPSTETNQHSAQADKEWQRHRLPD